jgi:hypothetical protein
MVMKKSKSAQTALALVASGFIASVFAGPAEAETPLVSRYPYDPACPWGRLSNGKGMLVRCLGEQEAQALNAKPADKPQDKALAVATGSGAQPEARSTAQPEAVDSKSTEKDSIAKPDRSELKSIQVSIGPVVADQGNLGTGKLGVASAKERYTACLADHGGFKGPTGEVQVRFLVRESGRAEGVSVAKRIAVTAEAATCIAQVVDRRYVGIPEAPAVGATVAVKFSKQP